MLKNKIKKFGIVILESLPDHEEKTAYELHSTIIQYKTYELPDLTSEFYEIKDRADLFWLLKELVRKTVEDDFLFVLHMEMHGFDNGIELKNGEEVTWGEMIPYFQEINVHFHNHLLIVLGICEGAGIIQYINPLERAPFNALISSEKKILLMHLIPGFEEFYKHFFFEFDAVEALEKYNAQVSDVNAHLIFVSAAYCFDQISDIERKTADKQKLKEIFLRRLLWKKPDLQNFPNDLLDKYINKEITKVFTNLKLKKNYFLMKDLLE